MLYLIVATKGGIRVDEVEITTETEKQYKIAGTVVDRKLVRKADLNEPMEYEYAEGDLKITLPFIFTLKEGIETNKVKITELIEKEEERIIEEYAFIKAIER